MVNHMMYKLEYTQKRNNMKRLDYILPMVGGVLLFGASLQQRNTWMTMLCMFISFVCISIAILERSKK